MNTYFHISFYPIYESISINKLLLINKIKSPFNPLKGGLLRYLIINQYFTWKYIFKINFWISRKKKIKYHAKPLKTYKQFIKNTHFTKFSNLIKNNFLIFFFFNNLRYAIFHFLFNNFKTNLNFRKSSIYFLNSYKRTIGDGLLYIRGLFIIFFIDACLTDDEPLWEPVEWSLVQTWIFFIFMFAWIAENLITSRYGSYTGRDKRVWFAWYKTFWFIELWYALSYAAATLFVMTPFYNELTYSVAFVFSWWNWYTRVFFFKFISIYTIVILISYIFQLNIRWLNWKKIMFFILIINFFIAYLLYTHFIMAFFGYFTDPLWYQKTRFIDYIQLSHEPLKWGWGPAKRDHFTYHRVSTIFWFKNDLPFAGSFLMIHLFFFLSLFFLYIYWLVLLRRVYTTKEVTYTLSTYCISALKQFYYFFFLLYLFIFMSFIVCYWRFPIEFLWLINSYPWMAHFAIILKDYFFFLFSIFF